MAEHVDLVAMGKRARQARRDLATLLTTTKNDLLAAIADALEDPTRQQAILEANARDIDAAQEAGLWRFDQQWAR